MPHSASPPRNYMYTLPKEKLSSTPQGHYFYSPCFSLSLFNENRSYINSFLLKPTSTLDHKSKNNHPNPPSPYHSSSIEISTKLCTKDLPPPQTPKMRTRFIAWFLVVTCTQAIANSGLHQERWDLDYSKSHMQTLQPFGGSSASYQTKNYGSIKEAIRSHIKDEEMQELSYDSIKKAQRGKGAAGGTNVNHRRSRSVNSAPSLLSWSSAVCVSLTIILLFSFFV